MTGAITRRRVNMNIALWIIQALLAALFLFAGGVKLVMPIEEMMKQMPIALPGWFVLFTGIVEVLGAIGLILPGLLRIRPGLTPLAAAGLVIVMIGATVYIRRLWPRAANTAVRLDQSSSQESMAMIAAPS